MATSSALSTSNQYVKYKITVTQNSQDVANNRSNVTVSVKFYRTNTGYTTYGSGKVYCRINGTLYSEDVTPSDKITSSGIVLFTKTLNISHSADGSKTLSTSAWISLNTPLTASEQSYNQKLTTIPRASQPSCITWPEHTQDVGDFGDTIAINMNRKSSSFTHTVRYQFGSKSGTIEKDVANGCYWEIPKSLMDLIPSATKGSGTIYVDTYNGSTKIGTKSCGFTAHVPTSVKPSCSIQVLDATDYSTKYGNLVQGLSKLKVNITAQKAYSSNIASASTTVTNGSDKKYSGLSFTSALLAKSGTVKVSSTVKDERGRTSAAASATFDVLAYKKPSIAGLAVHRCDENGVEDENGEWVRVNFSAAITALNNKNSAAYSLAYTNNKTGEKVENSLTDIAGTYTITDYAFIFPADSGSSYDITVTAKDDISSVTMPASVSTAFTLYNCHASGTGWAFGKVSEKEHTVEFGMPAEFIYGARGKVLGLGTLEIIPENSDLNDYLTAGVYSIKNNAEAETMKNTPSRQVAGRLIVSDSTGVTQDTNASYVYKEQLFLPHDMASGAMPWMRHVRKTSSGWTYYNWNSLALLAYPVGSIYIAYNHTDPTTLFGGTWVRISNRFLWGVDESGTIGTTGGTKTHTLTTDEMPAHTHKHTVATTTSGTEEGSNTIRFNNNDASYVGQISTTSAGGGKAHNNMPPYIQVSIWRRTA